MAKSGGRKGDKKFGVHSNSLIEQLNKSDFPPALRAKYYENMKKSREDQQSLELWALDGFSSGVHASEKQ